MTLETLEKKWNNSDIILPEFYEEIIEELTSGEYIHTCIRHMHNMGLSKPNNQITGFKFITFLFQVRNYTLIW